MRPGVSARNDVPASLVAAAVHDCGIAPGWAASLQANIFSNAPLPLVILSAKIWKRKATTDLHTCPTGHAVKGTAIEAPLPFQNPGASLPLVNTGIPLSNVLSHSNVLAIAVITAGVISLLDPPFTA